jgi:uncharacterized protein (DUF2336 family)
MPEARPRLTGEEDSLRLLRGAARRRAAAADDLFCPEPLRLTERERLTARDLFGKLVRTIEDELRASLADRFEAHEALQAALAAPHVEIARPLFDGAGAIGSPELVTLLLRRVEEHRLFRAAPNRTDRLQALIADPDRDIAADAMSVLIARSRRLDRFQEPILARTELPAELQHHLVWTVAAALRTYMVDTHRIEPAVADAALAAAASGTIVGYDEGDSLEARSMRLAQALHGAGRLDGALIAAFLLEGTLPLFLAGLSAATAIRFQAVWDILSDPAGQGSVHLLRAAGLDRQQAGDVLLALSYQPLEAALVGQIALFDATSPEAAMQALSLWALDPAYRDAVLNLAEGRPSE